MDQENLNPNDIFVTLIRTRRQVMGGQTEAHGRCGKGSRPSDIAWWLGVVPFRLAIPARKAGLGSGVGNGAWQ